MMLTLIYKHKYQILLLYTNLNIIPLVVSNLIINIYFNQKYSFFLKKNFFFLFLKFLN